MTLWYRCQMCSLNQSRDFDVPLNDPPLSVALRLVNQEHARVSPNCPVTLEPWSAVEILLVRLVQMTVMRSTLACSILIIGFSMAAFMAYRDRDLGLLVFFGWAAGVNCGILMERFPVDKEQND